jgi:hypothetical protein
MSDARRPFSHIRMQSQTTSAPLRSATPRAATDLAFSHFAQGTFLIGFRGIFQSQISNLVFGTKDDFSSHNRLVPTCSPEASGGKGRLYSWHAKCAIFSAPPRYENVESSPRAKSLFFDRERKKTSLVLFPTRFTTKNRQSVAWCRVPVPAG